MLEAYEEQIQALHDEVAELGRIRRGLLAHLGEALLQEVHGNPELRRGREQILAAIERADRERARLEDRMAELDARVFAAREERRARDEQGAAADVAAAAEPVPVAVGDVVADVVEDVVPEAVLLEVAEEPEPQVPAIEVSEEAAATVAEAQVAEVAAVSVDEYVPAEAQDEGTAAAEVCPACGAPVGATHKFCMSCGQRLR